MKKKVISFLLALVMVLGMLPATGGVEVAEAATSFQPRLPVDSNKVIVNGLDTYFNGGSHNGIDLVRTSTAYNYQDIYAIADGEIYAARNSCPHEYYDANHACPDTWGNYIAIKHTYSGETYFSVYAHLKYDSIKVSYGNKVSEGQVIAQMGTSGGSTAHHLHLEVWKGAWSDKNALHATSFDYYMDNPAADGLLFNAGLVTYSNRYSSWIKNNCVKESEGYRYNANTLIKEELPTYCHIKTTAATNIMSLPCSAKTDASSKVLEEVSSGKTETAYKLVLNKVGNYWYEVRTSSGAKGYIPSAKVSWVKDLTDVKITGQTNPPDMVQGSRYTIQGTISAKYNMLTAVSAYVYAGNDTSGGKEITGGFAGVSNNSYTLANSSIDMATYFNNLSVGNYTYVVRAEYRNYYAVNEKTADYHVSSVALQASSFSITTPSHSHSWKVLLNSTYHWEECSTCGEQRNVTAHSFEMRHNETKHWKYCTVCAATVDNASHTFSAWRVTKQPTYTATGTEKRTCSVCSYAETRTLAKLKLGVPAVTASNNAKTGKPVLKWPAVTGAEKYEIWRSTTETGTYSRFYTATATQFTNTSVAAGDTYYYKVRAVVGDVYGDFSAPIGRTCDCAAPVLTVSNNATTGKPVLRWEHVEGADKYRVYRAESEDGTYSNIWTSTASSFSGTLTLTNTKNLEDGKTYYYKVRAYISANEYATSAYSNVAECTYTHIHTIVTDKAVAATCTTAGKTEGKHCSVCGVVTVAQKTIAAKGHTYVDGVCTVCGVEDPDYIAPLTGVTRIFGADRYETAFKTAEVLKQQLGVEKFDNIVVACGDNFADALGGSYLAAKKGAPILLVKSSKIDAVKSYIKANLNPGGNVYLLGGTAAIPAAMDTGLDGFTVRRLAGATRYDTNLLILEEAGVTNEDILICTGKSFADSLSAAAAGRPLLLVKDSLNDSQKAFLQSHAANKKYILGGTAAVSTSVENQAKAYGTVKRIGGNTRYETSVLIAQEFFPDATQAALAYAQNFPDGLSGGALAYAMKAPLVLTASGKEAAAAAYAKEQNITSGVILGGSGLISDKAARTIFQMQSGDTIKIG